MPPRKARGGVRGGGWAGTDQGGGLGAGPGEAGDRGAHHHLQLRRYLLWLQVLQLVDSEDGLFKFNV